MILGDLSLDLKQIKCDPQVFLRLANLAPVMWDETIRIFKSIWCKIPKHKYYHNDDTKVMDNLKFPKCGNEVFYDLQKHLMPLPSYTLLYPQLRYLFTVEETYFFIHFEMSIILFFRSLDLFWAVSSDQNLILTLNPTISEDHLPNSFNNIINQSTLHLFQHNKRSSASLFAAGIYKGNFMGQGD